MHLRTARAYSYSPAPVFGTAPYVNELDRSHPVGRVRRLLRARLMCPHPGGRSLRTTWQYVWPRHHELVGLGEVDRLVTQKAGLGRSRRGLVPAILHDVEASSCHKTPGWASVPEYTLMGQHNVSPG